MTALVQCIDVVLLLKAKGKEVPRMSCLATTVEKQHGLLASAAPIKIVKAESVYDHMSAFGFNFPLKLQTPNFCCLV